MIYDSFTITVLMQLEALGFCKRGEGGAFVAAGGCVTTASSRSTPTAAGFRPTIRGCAGSSCVIEATKQLRGEGGPRQVKKPLQNRDRERDRRHSRLPARRCDPDSFQPIRRYRTCRGEKKRNLTEALPSFDEENRPCWEATQRHELYVQRCGDCGTSSTIRGRFAPVACRRECAMGQVERAGQDLYLHRHLSEPGAADFASRSRTSWLTSSWTRA